MTALDDLISVWREQYNPVHKISVLENVIEDLKRGEHNELKEHYRILY